MKSPTANTFNNVNYYAFGMVMPGRSYTPPPTANYRFGHNGQEKDAEIFDGAYTAEFWEYDSRSGRRWERDPVVDPTMSPYTTFDNNPIFFADPSGAEPEGGEGPPEGGSEEGGSTPNTVFKPGEGSGEVGQPGGDEFGGNYTRNPDDSYIGKQGGDYFQRGGSESKGGSMGENDPSPRDIKTATDNGRSNALWSNNFFGIGRGNPLEEYSNPRLQKAYALGQLHADAISIVMALLEGGIGGGMTTGGLSQAAATSGFAATGYGALVPAAGLATAAAGAVIQGHAASVIAVATAGSVKTLVILNSINAHDGNSKAGESDNDEGWKNFKDSPPNDPDFTPKKNWDGKKVKNPNGSGSGWPDKKGNVWVPQNHKGTHGFHWDVQSSGGKYQAIYPK